MVLGYYETSSPLELGRFYDSPALPSDPESWLVTDNHPHLEYPELMGYFATYPPGLPTPCNPRKRIVDSGTDTTVGSRTKKLQLKSCSGNAASIRQLSPLKFGSEKSMNYIHFIAIIQTLLFYTFLAAAYFGWGKAFTLAATQNKSRTGTIPQSFLIWAGWACTLLLFQFIHFFLPINAYSVGPSLLLGAAFSLIVLIRNRTSRCGLPSFTIYPSKYIVTTVVIGLLLTAIWLASRAMLTPGNYDSGLYHLNAIRWTNEYPLVPGLGNLHGRLAFNSSFFTYVAALNLDPLFGTGQISK